VPRNGDLIFGKKMTSIGTLVERHSRYVILLKLPNGHGAEAVRKAMTKRILTLPAQLRRYDVVALVVDAMQQSPSPRRGF
jgi:IS30 family transposase